MEKIISAYFPTVDHVELIPIVQGHINTTYKVSINEENYILQKINTSIFKHPERIISNMLLIGNHLKSKKYKKGIIDVIPNLKGEYLTIEDGETWRLTSYIPNSVCYDKVVSDTQAFVAANAISEFHENLIDIKPDQIQESIDGFLDYQKRINDYQSALDNGSQDRKAKAQSEIKFINDHLYLIEKYLKIDFPQRIVHADAKISNFLFDESDEIKILALIDWDTIVPGNILCDFGDMIRTYSNLKAEDDPDPKNNFSINHYIAVKQGFLSKLKKVISEKEIESIDLTGYVVILVQAIRFLTDYLNQDIYYHTSRENQNLDRTINQINLLKSIQSHICIN